MIIDDRGDLLAILPKSDTLMGHRSIYSSIYLIEIAEGGGNMRGESETCSTSRATAAMAHISSIRRVRETTKRWGKVVVV